MTGTAIDVRANLAARDPENSVGIEVKAQRFRPDEGDVIALPLPGRSLAQCRDQVVVGLRPRRRAGAVLQRSGDKDHGVAGHRKLALAALAPEFEDRLAAVADFQVRYPFRSDRKSTR